jgi:hypothetical protein
VRGRHVEVQVYKGHVIVALQATHWYIATPQPIMPAVVTCNTPVHRTPISGPESTERPSPRAHLRLGTNFTRIVSAFKLRALGQAGFTARAVAGIALGARRSGRTREQGLQC